MVQRLKQWDFLSQFVSYLLLPTFFNQTDISKKLNNELQVKYDLNFKFSQNIKYNFFPRPHFIITDSKIFDNKKDIAEISKLKILVINKTSSSIYLKKTLLLLIIIFPPWKSLFNSSIKKL